MTSEPGDKEGGISRLSVTKTEFVPGSGSSSYVLISGSNLNIMRGGEEYSLPISWRVKKSADTYPIGSIGHLRQDIKDWGVKRATKHVLRGIAHATLFKSEIKNLQDLNRKKNPYVPSITRSRNGFYEMTFIHGEPGSYIYPEIDRDTKIFVANKYLDVAQSVFNDGYVNLEFSPKNSVIQVDFKTGRLQKVNMIDFGLSYPVDKNGQIEIDMDLLRRVEVRAGDDHDGYGIVPPEARDKTGKVKINAEKALVYSLATRVIFEIFSRGTREEVEFFKRSVSTDPNSRPSFKEFMDFYKNLPADEAKVGSCVSQRTLDRLKRRLGQWDSEIYIDSRKLDAALENLSKPNKG